MVSVRVRIIDSVWARVRFRLRERVMVRDRIWAKFRDTVRVTVRDKVWFRVRDSVRDCVRNRVSVKNRVGLETWLGLVLGEQLGLS